MIIALVAVGGAVGAVIRWFVTQNTSHASGFPVGVTIVNVVGSFLLGWLVGAGVDTVMGLHSDVVSSGLLGGLTTFSTWMVDIDEAESRRMTAGVVGIPIVLGVVAAVVGLGLGAMAA